MEKLKNGENGIELQNNNVNQINTDEMQQKEILDNEKHANDEFENNKVLSLYERGKYYYTLPEYLRRYIFDNDYRLAVEINKKVDEIIKQTTQQKLADKFILEIEKNDDKDNNIKLRSELALLYDLSYVSKFSVNGIAVGISKSGEYVYISKSGEKMKIKGVEEKNCKYISEFKNNIAYIVVQTKDGNESFYIKYNPKERMLERVSQSYVRTENFSEEGIACVLKRFVNDTGITYYKWVFINDKFKQISGKYQSVQSFSEGFGAIQLQNKKWKYINMEMREVGDEYVEVRPFLGSISAVKLDDNKWYLIDNQFKKINKNGYEDVKYSKYTDIYAVKQTNGKWIFLNKKTNQKVFDAEYDIVGVFSEDGITWVLNKGKSYYINTAGEKIFDNNEFKRTYDYKEGIAKVQLKDGSYCYIDINGNKVF